MRNIIVAGLIALMLCGSSGIWAQEAGEDSARGRLKIKLTSVFVDNQEKALKFYTEILGFVKKADSPVGEYRWLTVVSPEELDGVELLLEPNVNPAAEGFQKSIHKQGIPAATFFVSDIQGEFERLTDLGVKFTTKPSEVAGVTIAVFDDTCGNLIMIVQE